MEKVILRTLIYADKKDDIDLFIITAKDRLWISRLLVLGLLAMIGQRRKAGDSDRKIAGKLCINTLLEQDKLEQSSKYIYLAHEVLQMRPLWYRDGMYGKYLQANQWVFKYIPNWVGPQTQNSKLKIMNKSKGMERIQDGALYFQQKTGTP